MHPDVLSWIAAAECRLDVTGWSGAAIVFTTDVTSIPRLPRVRASELVGRGWLNTGGRTVTLADLRGKVVVLDFWTFCCINCLHVLDELRALEAAHRDVLVVVGVHSPKFVHEADPGALAAAVERYEVHHPVLDDPELTTWSAYGARAWPTLVVVDPEGYIVGHMAGEGHTHHLEVLIGELVAEHEAKGTLHSGYGPYVPPAAHSSTLRFPAKVIRLPPTPAVLELIGDDGAPIGSRSAGPEGQGTLLVADAGHHSLVELAADGETLLRRIGSGERGLVDGGPGEARFAEPNGLCLVPDELRGRLGYDVLVADTANHVLRGVRLADGGVTTVAGTGEQYMVGGSENVRAWTTASCRTAAAARVSTHRWTCACPPRGTSHGPRRSRGSSSRWRAATPCGRSTTRRARCCGSPGR